MKGSEYVTLWSALSPSRVDEEVKAAIARGDMIWPGDLRRVPVQSADGSAYAIDVMLDYLAIGEPGDWIHVPLSGPGAVDVANALGFRLPTQREVDAIYEAADVRVEFAGMGPPYDASMQSMTRVAQHSRRVQEIVGDRTGLIAGGGKDVLGVRPAVASDYLVRHFPQSWRVGMLVLAFYGGFDAHGHPVQRDDGAHEPSYYDGSHRVRLVRDVRDIRDTDPGVVETGS